MQQGHDRLENRIRQPKEGLGVEGVPPQPSRVRERHKGSFEVLQHEPGRRRLATDVSPVRLHPLLPDSPLRRPLAKLVLDRLLLIERLQSQAIHLH